MIIVINGCFSSGKNTISNKLAGSIERCGFIDPDLFASFRPSLMPDDFDSYGFTWNLIETILREMTLKNMHCVMQVVVAPGITSIDPNDVEKRLHLVSSAIRWFTLFPSLERVKKQNKKRNDITYPEHILEKCWKIIDNTRNKVENSIIISDSESVEEIVERIKNEVNL